MPSILARLTASTDSDSCPAQLPMCNPSIGPGPAINVVDPGSAQSTKSQNFQSDLPEPVIYDPATAADLKRQGQASLIGISVIVVLVIVLVILWVCCVKRSRKAVKRWYARVVEKMGTLRKGITREDVTSPGPPASITPSEEAKATPESSTVDLVAKEGDLEKGTTLPTLPSQPASTQVSVVHVVAGGEPPPVIKDNEGTASIAGAKSGNTVLKASSPSPSTPAFALAIPRDESLKRGWVSWTDSFRTFVR